MIKIIFGILSFSLVIGSAWYAKYEYHDKLLIKINSLEKELGEIGYLLNECFMGAKKSKVEQYIEEVGSEKDDSISVDLSNLHT